MDSFQLFAALTTLAALFSWVNHRVLRLPTLDEALAAPPGRLNVDQSLPLTLRRGQPPP